MADDLISRQAAIDAVRELYIKSPKINNDIVYDTAIDQAHDVLVSLPSAQPEIIRCRDCKHWDKTWTNNWSPDYHYCPVMDEVRKGDRYCRYAERGTDG